jgi:hypothetical protein
VYVITAYAAFRRGLLVEIGGFDPRLGPVGERMVANEDTVLSREFASRGRLHHVPDAVCIHELPASRLRPAYLLKRAYIEGRSEWMMERDRLAGSRLCGIGRALRTLRTEAGRRRAEGIARPPVAFHAACDVTRAAGSLTEAVRMLARRLVSSRPR